MTSFPPEPQHLERSRFVEMLKLRMSERDLSQYDLADLLGISQPYVSQLLSENGQKMPSRTVLRKSLDILDIDWPDVASDPEPASTDTATLPPDHILVPRTPLVSAGNDGMINPPTSEPHAYHRRDLTHLTNLSDRELSSLYAMTVVGDSLAPEIIPGSTVLVLPLDEYLGDGLYVLSIDGAELAKRIQRLSDGSLRLLPINSAYSPELLTPMPDADTPNTFRQESTGRAAQVRIVGKVVGYLKPA